MDPITAALGLGSKLIERLWPDPAQADAAKLELLRLQQSGELAQITGQLEVNKAEAASSSVFVAGWRPAVGWVCASALAYTYLLYPLLLWIAAAWWPQVKPPVLGNDGMLFELLLGMLGLGGLRTYEKLKGVAR
jgi:uncharacterized membrane protein